MCPRSLCISGPTSCMCPSSIAQQLYIILAAAQCIYLLAVSAFLSLTPLTSKSFPLLLWQHNPDVCHFHGSGHTHTHRTHSHTHSTLRQAETSNHITNTGIHAHTHTNTFVGGDSRPLKGRAVSPHHEPNEARVASRWEGKERRWTDGWSETREQYGAGWAELCTSEATDTSRQISGAWNRLGEKRRDSDGGRQKAVI